MKIITREKMALYLIDRPALKPADGRKKKKKKTRYLDTITAFDIETTTTYINEEPQAVMYIWQFCADDFVTYGRTWEQYRQMIGTVSDFLPEDVNIVTYVHNLSFEFQFLSGIFEFLPEDVFCTAPRKILRATSGKMEYRCSYLLSNDSLFGFCEKHKVKHTKQSGAFYDYSKERYYFTPLTLYEYKYALYDVVGLVECIKAELALYRNDLYSIPMTATGYVRNDVKSVLYQFNKTRQPWLQPRTVKMYQRLKEAFRGGNVHANRFYSNVLLPETDAGYWSFDISSSYPTQMITKKFPMSTWKEGPTAPADVLDLKKRGYCMLFVFSVVDCCLRDKYDGFPSLSESKCRNVLGPTLDNGRILSASYFETTMTDVDFDMFTDQYDADIVFKEVYYCRRDYLPLELRHYILSAYKDKTELKGVKGDLAETRYMQAKARINSIYGLTVQDVIKSRILFKNNEYIEDPDFDLNDEIQKNIMSAYMSYSWGVFVTAFARKSLHDGILTASKTGDVIYCDTDSVKGAGSVDFSKLNERLIFEAKKNNALAYDRFGNVHYMGVFEQEKSYDEFITLGAKKYAYSQDRHIGITIAGVNKKQGAKQITDDGGLSVLKEGYVFKNATTSAVYNDSISTTAWRDGRRVDITKNVALIQSDYTLGITADYAYILEHPETFYDIFRS